MKSQKTVETNISVQILVSGRVQGVGFRQFTRKIARDLNLSGWVRNLVDGRVQAVVMGPEELVERFCIRVKNGPMNSQVNDFQVIKNNGELESFGSFVVRPDGDSV